MIRRCQYELCNAPLPKHAKITQKFCSSPGKTCRQKYHKEQRLPGTVKGLRQLANGQWSVTIHFPNQPECGMKAQVRIETGTSSRQEPSCCDNLENTYNHTRHIRNG